MKNIRQIIIVFALLIPSNCIAQTNTGTVSAKEGFCNSVKAEKDAEKSMKGAVKEIYKAGTDTRETALRDAVYPVICNTKDSTKNVRQGDYDDKKSREAAKRLYE